MLKGLLRIKPDKATVFLCFGVGTISYGASLVYLPAGYIVLGALLIALSVVADMSNRPKSPGGEA